MLIAILIPMAGWALIALLIATDVVTPSSAPLMEPSPQRHEYNLPLENRQLQRDTIQWMDREQRR